MRVALLALRTYRRNLLSLTAVSCPLTHPARELPESGSHEVLLVCWRGCRSTSDRRPRRVGTADGARGGAVGGGRRAAQSFRGVRRIGRRCTLRALARLGGSSHCAAAQSCPAACSDRLPTIALSTRWMCCASCCRRHLSDHFRRQTCARRGATAASCRIALPGCSNDLAPCSRNWRSSHDDPCSGSFSTLASPGSITAVVLCQCDTAEHIDPEATTSSPQDIQPMLRRAETVARSRSHTHDYVAPRHHYTARSSRDHRNRPPVPADLQRPARHRHQKFLPAPTPSRAPHLKLICRSPIATHTQYSAIRRCCAEHSRDPRNTPALASARHLRRVTFAHRTARRSTWLLRQPPANTQAHQHPSLNGQPNRPPPFVYQTCPNLKLQRTSILLLHGH